MSEVGLTSLLPRESPAGQEVQRSPLPQYDIASALNPVNAQLTSYLLNANANNPNAGAGSIMFPQKGAAGSASDAVQPTQLNNYQGLRSAAEAVALDGNPQPVNVVPAVNVQAPAAAAAGDQ